MNEGTPIIVKKKKGHGGHAHHGGSWKVAYADFVTAMMAFFMVLWIMGLSDATRAQVSGYFNDPTGFNKVLQHSKNEISFNLSPPSLHGGESKKAKAVADHKEVDAKSLKGIEKKLREALKAQAKAAKKDLALAGISSHVEITMTDKGLKIEFLETEGSVFFDSGSYLVRPQARPIIVGVGRVLAKTGRIMQIQGHTDAHPYGRPDYNNFNLSSDRAIEVMGIFQQCGVQEKQFRPVEAWASLDPKIPSDPYAPANRRVSVLLPFEDVLGKVMGPKEEEEVERKSQFVEGFSIHPQPPTPEERKRADALAEHADSSVRNANTRRP